jgi:hypothetical protein
MSSLAWTVVSVLWLIACCPGAVSGETKGSAKASVGVVEEILLLPWGVRLPARVDTGATTSSLDARDMDLRGDTVEFSLPAKYGGQRICLPVVDWKFIRSAESREKRPVVEMEICMGPKKIRARVNLNDRSRMKYPVIVGRNILKHDFVVDPLKEMIAPPLCEEVQAR